MKDLSVRQQRNMKDKKRPKDKKTIAIHALIDSLKTDLTKECAELVCRWCASPLTNTLIGGLRSLDEGDIVQLVCVKCNGG